MKDTKWRERALRKNLWGNGKNNFEWMEIGWSWRKISDETVDIKQNDGKQDPII